MALISVLGAPFLGFVLMVMAWATVDTGFRGGIDFGVLLFGAAGAVLLVYAIVREYRLSTPAAAALMTTTFLITFGIPALLIWALFFSGPGTGGFD